ESNGQAELFLRPSSNTGASSFYRHWRLGSSRQVVRTMRLDDLLAETKVAKVRVMKVDCEGAEALVIRGASNYLARHAIDFCIVHYHTHITGVDECERAHAALLQAGYLLAKLDHLCVYMRPTLEPEALNCGLSLADTWRN